ncbi:hypothetical protein SAMN05216229_101255 [Geopseudomonas sagittaria]|uniref:Uncharacterized protein n=1 Tax=Geopseudomonas sagittaria TaxID=1135990 RepID=A0A1I5P043_9GAMM|nr:hypothetical protein [Pseudomonas sagittaria]MCM2329819.1 hypothetical protein [Pseudomonas sagittaria]SFP27424.1 hypothetical protein SAMN05216229_101255 [Pseudomonas sagittaria]
MKTATRSVELSSRAHGNSSTGSEEAPSKIARLLKHLLAGASVNRFEAERLGDHCLPSTVAVLANRHGLIFKRLPEKVPNSWGKPCYVTRYSLPVSEYDKARKVLALLSTPSKRAAA